MKNDIERIPQLGDVYLVKLEGTGNEQKGLRPALIFQNNRGNTYSPNVTILPMTSKIKKLGQPTHVYLPASSTGLLRDSIVLCENPVSMSKDKLGKYVTTIPDRYLSEIAEANILASSAIAFVDPELLIRIQQRAQELNKLSVGM